MSRKDIIFGLFVLFMNAAVTITFAALNVDISAIGEALSANSMLLPDGYVIGVMCSIPLTPTLLATWTPKRLFTVSAVGLMATSALASCAHYGLGFASALFLHGLFTAPVVPATQSLCATRFTDPKLRQRLLSYWMATTISGVLAGYVIGAFLAEHLSWRAAIVLCWIPAIVALLLLPRVDFGPAQPRAAAQPFDAVGAVLIAAVMVSITGALVFGSHLGWGRTPAVHQLLLVIGGASAWFVVRYRTTPNPVLDFSVLQNRWLAGALLATFLLDASSTGVFQTELLSSVLHLDPEWIALRSSASGIAMLCAVVLADRLMQLLGTSRAAAIALCFLLIGKSGFLFYHPGIRVLDMLWPAVTAGLGYGMVSTILAVTACRGVDARSSPAATTLYAVAIQMGSSVGLAGFDAILETRQRMLLHASGHSDPIRQSFSEVFSLELAAAVLILPVTMFFFRRAQSPDVSPGSCSDAT